jgi:KUP system potassium uptake protein
MEAAYGLAITATMLMTTILLFQYLRVKKIKPVFIALFLIFFGALESVFLISNATKFVHGGYVAVIIALFIFAIMLIWHLGHKIEKKHDILLPAAKFVEQLGRLKEDDSIPYTAVNLVFMTINGDIKNLERDVLYSIFDKRPKRAQVYWFIHINVVDDPDTMAYSIENFGTDYCFKVKLKLGFKVEQRINVFMRQIIHDLIKSGELKPQVQAYSLYEGSNVGDFKFVFIKKTLAPNSDVTGLEHLIMRLKYTINNFTGSPIRWFGLENASTIIESVPLLVKPDKKLVLKREK